ncbi:MAG: YtxH domain-containing protein [Bacteroidia bacterium]|jgi:gas vesicle protein
MRFKSFKRYRRSSSNLTAKVLIALVAGAALGAVTSLLLAPDKGTKTREKIADSALKLKNNVQDSVKKQYDNIVGQVEKTKENGHQTSKVRSQQI